MTTICLAFVWDYFFLPTILFFSPLFLSSYPSYPPSPLSFCLYINKKLQALAFAPAFYLLKKKHGLSNRAHPLCVRIIVHAHSNPDLTQKKELGSALCILGGCVKVLFRCPESASVHENKHEMHSCHFLLLSSDAVFLVAEISDS